MGRLAIRRIEYFGDMYEFTSPELPDGLVIVEGANGSGKTTFADLIYFALGGSVKKFNKKGKDQHKEIREDSANGVRLTLEIDGQRHYVTRYFDKAPDVLVASEKTEQVQVLPVVRRADHTILSDWLLTSLGIEVVTLFLGPYRGKLNFADVMRLVYHDQDPDPTRVFKKPDSDNFVSDSRDFRRAIFEILIGKVSEEYYQVLGDLKIAQGVLGEREGALSAYRAAVERAARSQPDSQSGNADFLKKQLEESTRQLARLEDTRNRLRKTAPNAPAADTELVAIRQQLASAELSIAETYERLDALRTEKVRLRTLQEQLVDEVLRVQKIIHAHETLALFSPDTCPCCLRPVNRATGHCICSQPVDEASYQRFFYSSDEYLNILKSKQKNVETVREAYRACDVEFNEVGRLLSKHQTAAASARTEVGRWAGTGGTYSTELERTDDEIVRLKVASERLLERLELELERDKLERAVNQARLRVESLRIKAQELEAKAQADRSEKVAQFNQTYTALMRATLKDVRLARLDTDYEPVLNDSEYREASSAVTRRLMYFVTLLQMSLSDAQIPFPRFLLIDTPETAGIDQENLSRAIGTIPKVLGAFSTPAQVILTTGPGKYPQELQNLRVVTLSEADRLLRRRAETDNTDAGATSEQGTPDVDEVDHEEMVIQALHALAPKLVDSDDQITGLIAETNANGYYHDDIHVIDVGPYDQSSSKLPFRALIHFSGDQDPERMFLGKEIVAEVSGTLSFDGTEWELDDNYEVVAEIEPYADEGSDE